MFFVYKSPARNNRKQCVLYKKCNNVKASKDFLMHRKTWLFIETHPHIWCRCVGAFKSERSVIMSLYGDDNNTTIINNYLVIIVLFTTTPCIKSIQRCLLVRSIFRRFIKFLHVIISLTFN